MSFTSDFLSGMAELLAGDGIGLSYNADGAYSDDQTGIFIAAVPQSPDRIVTLSPYSLGDDATANTSMQGLQIRSRSAGQDPRDAYALDDAIFNALAGLFPVVLPSAIVIETLTRTSSTPLGQDANLRWLVASNYALDLYRPTSHRV